ncbi:MAG: membrane protein insertase YidC [Deltaproteobacteria bacterium]
MSDENKNLILAVILSGLVMVVWLTFFQPPPAPVTPSTDLTTGQLTPPPTTEVTPTVTNSVAALNAAKRITIDTPKLTGSLSTLGGRLDDLELKDYRVTLDPGSPLVRLLGAEGTNTPYYAVYGWLPVEGATADQVPGANTPFTQEGVGDLTPATPVTLTWDNGAGLIFKRTYSVDDKYLISVAQTVENTTATPVSLKPYGLVVRRTLSSTASVGVRHEGAIRQCDNELEEIKYSKIDDLSANTLSTEVTGSCKNDRNARVASTGWVGFTDAYWMTTLIPDADHAFTSITQFTAEKGYEIGTVLDAVAVAPGATITSDSRLFAGAKDYDVIKDYQNNQGVYRFIDSIDWGWFFFLTKPMFAVLHWLHAAIGNMGWAIIALTVFIKTLVFPLSYKSYVSMAKMKELQPEMEKMKERVGDDRQKMQVETIALYKKNKVNPAAGCLPILIQIPIFFSLYKVIYVTIELYHAPWFGWIHDLSSPDPSSILNLFGLLPYATPEVGSALHIISLGVLPILLGISMWFQQKLNPAPTDPTQQAIFAWMPWIFMFMLGSFASGLVVYWIANNTLTFIQQYTIMSIHGKRPDIFGNIRASAKRKPADVAKK